MPYPQDLVGKYINYRVDPGGTMNPGLSSSMVNGVLPGQTTPAVVGVYTSSAPAMIGAHRAAPGTLDFVNTNVPWSFTFLKYIGGAVTTAPLNGPVLTGPMSGCYLCTYAQSGPHLAHIGTANSPDSAESVAVKTAWRNFVCRKEVSQVSGGSPFDYFTTAEFSAAMLSPSSIPLVVGYFAGGAAHAMLLAPVPANMYARGPLLKVAAIKRMTPQPWVTLAAMRRFRD